MDGITTRVKVCFSSGHHAKVVLTFTALIRTLLSGRAGNFTSREIKRCILGVYKFKHRMIFTKDLLTGLTVSFFFVRSGVIVGVFTTDELLAKSFLKPIIDVKGQGDVLTFR